MSTKKPNIVFILSDDQGAWAMGCSGNEEIITPNLDKLAAEGMRFENLRIAGMLSGAGVTSDGENSVSARRSRLDSRR